MTIFQEEKKKAVLNYNNMADYNFQDTPQKDITQSGALSFRELQNLNNQRQSERLLEDYNNSTQPDGLDDLDDYQKSDLLRQYYSNAGIYDRSFINQDRDLAEEYYNAGYGKSKYDENITNIADLALLEQNRAENQTYLEQLTNGALKMGTIATTTFADNFVGTVVGVANLLGEAAAGNIHSGKDALNAFVRNPFSLLMQDINKKAEDWFPNWYTEEEKNTPWYNQFWHANFIGDHFLKNTGFMIGAAASAKVSAGLLSKAVGLEKARDVFRGTALASGAPESATAKEVLNAYKTGKSIAGVDKITESLAQSAKQLKNAETKLKIASIASGSFGESRMESISNSGDDFDKSKALLDQDRERAIQNIIPQLQEEQPDLFTLSAERDIEGNITSYRTVPKNQEDFQKAFDAKLAEIDDIYNRGLGELSKEKIDYSNSSFLLNFLLTFGEGWQMFGDAITGGYTMNRAVRDLVTKNGEGYEALRNLATKKVIRGAMSPAFEGTQEMFQQGVAEGLSRWEAQKFNNFYGKGINPNGFKAATDWLSTMTDALGDVYSDPEQWENFAMGFFTALLPIPGRGGSSITTDSEGNPQVEKGKFKVSGEFWDSIREARNINKEASAQAKSLNDIIEDPEKRAHILGMVRHIVDDNIQVEALERGDKRTFKDAEFDKFINMAITFSEAGRSQDFLDLVESIYNVEEKDIEGLKALTMFKDGKGSLFDGMKDSDIIDYFAQKKEKVLDLAKKIQKTESDITTLYGDSRSKAFKQELLYDIMAADNREQRIKDLTSKILDYVNSRKQELQDKYGYDVGEQLQNIQDLNVFFGSEDGIDELNRLITLASSGSESAMMQFNKKLKERSAKRRQLSGRVLGLQNTINRLEAKLADGTITDEERRRLSQTKRRVSRAKTDISRIAETIDDIKENLKEEGDRYNPELLTVTSDLNDLLPLLINREYLLHRLNALSNNPNNFEEGLTAQIMSSINSFNERKLNNIFEEFVKTRDLNLIGKNNISFEALKNKINAGTDEGLKGYIAAVEKYSDIFEKNEDKQFNLKDRATKALYGEVQEAIKPANSVEDADKRVKDLITLLDTTGALGPETSSLTRALTKALSADKKVKSALDDNSKKAEKKSKSQTGTKGKLSEIKDIDKEIANLTKEELLDFIDEYELNAEVAKYVGYLDGDETADYTQEDEEILRSAIAYVYDDILSENSESEEAEEAEEDEDEEVTASEPKEKEKKDSKSGSSADVINEIETEIEPETEKKNTEVKSPSKVSGPIYLNNSGESNEGNAESNESGNSPISDEDALAVNRQGAKYDYKELKNPKKRRAILNKQRTWAKNILENARVQEFLDSGQLAILQQEAEVRGEKLKVRFVQIRGNEGEGVKFDSRVQENSIKNNTLFIAVEVPRNTKVGAPYLFYDADGKVHNMQLLGVVSKGLGISNAKKARFERLLKAVQLQTTAAKAKNGRIQPFAASFIYTNLEWIFTGRIVKSTEDIELGERDLLEIFSDKELAEQKDGNDQLQIVVKRSDFTKDDIVFGKDLGGEVVELNQNRPQTGGRNTGLRNKSNRNGTVWIRTKEADGKVYYKGVKVRNFDENYTADDSPIAKRIKGAISNMIKANANWREAAIDLQKYLYVPEGKRQFYIDSENRTFRIGEDAVDFDSENAVQEIYDLIKEQGYRFSLGLAKFSVSDILNSHILYTDLAMLHNVNSSFLVSEVDVDLSEDEKSVEDYEIIPSKTVAQVIADERVHTGRLGVQAGRDYSHSIEFSGKDEKYKISTDEDGGHTYWLLTGEQPTEEVTDIKQQFLIEFKFLIDTNRAGNPVGYIPVKGRKRTKSDNVYMMKSPTNGSEIYMMGNGRVLSLEDRKNLKIVKTGGRGKEAALKKLQNLTSPEAQEPQKTSTPTWVSSMTDEELRDVSTWEGGDERYQELEPTEIEDFKVGDTYDFEDRTVVITEIDTENNTIKFDDDTEMNLNDFIELNSEIRVAVAVEKELNRRGKKPKEKAEEPQTPAPKPKPTQVILPGKGKIKVARPQNSLEQITEDFFSKVKKNVSLRGRMESLMDKYEIPTIKTFKEKFNQALLSETLKKKIQELMESTNPNDLETVFKLFEDNIECFGIA